MFDKLLFDRKNAFDRSVSLDEISISSTLSGSSQLDFGLTVKTAITSSIYGSSFFSSSIIVHRAIIHSFGGFGGFESNPQLILKTEMPGEIHGNSEMSIQNQKVLSLEILQQGQGDVTFYPLGKSSQRYIELNNIEFLPGQTITIDTNLLQVLFENIEDVSSVSNNSVFFDLSPGENEISINVGAEETGELDVTVIWQNRWL